MERKVDLGSLIIDRETFTASLDGRDLALTFKEFELLFALAARADSIVPRNSLQEAIWGDSTGDASGALTIHVSRLRQKLESSRDWMIRTAKKRGYGLVSREAMKEAVMT